jgi:hypothetical protein
VVENVRCCDSNWLDQTPEVVNKLHSEESEPYSTNDDPPGFPQCSCRNTSAFCEKHRNVGIHLSGHLEAQLGQDPTGYDEEKCSCREHFVSPS